MTLYNLFEGITTDTVEADADALTLGTEFWLTAPAWVTALRFLKGTGDTTTLAREMGISKITDAGAFESSVVPLTTMPLGTEGWVEQAITPVQLAAGRYRAGCFFPQGQYPAQAQWFSDGPNAVDVVRGPVTIPATYSTANGNGLYTYGASYAMPASSFNATAYFVDVTISDVEPVQVPSTATLALAVRSGAGWVEQSGEVRVRQSGAWVNAELRRFKNGAWTQ